MRGPAMAKALTTPSTILATGAVCAGAIAAGLPIAIVGGLAALAYGIVSALTVARPREIAKIVFPDLDIDLGRLDGTGSTQMQTALTAREAYRTALRDCPVGPFRERFTDMNDRVTDVVEGVYKLVVRAQSLRAYLSRNPARRKEEQLARAQSNLRAARAESQRAEMQHYIDALEEQLAARARIQQAHDLAMAKIETTTARVDQLGAQLTEVVLLGEDRAAAAFPDAAQGVTRLVEELDSVRLALDEVGASGSLAVPPRIAEPN